MTKATFRGIDIVLMILSPGVAAIATGVFSTNLLVSTLIFYGIPSIYLGLRNPGILRKSAQFAFFFSIPLSFVFDTLAAYDESWIIPDSVSTFRLYGVATIEVYVFGLLWVFFATLFYEYFFGQGERGEVVAVRMRYLTYFFMILIIAVALLFYTNNSWLHIPYYFAWGGLIFVLIPLELFLISYPRYLLRFIAIGIYFFIYHLTFEVVALQSHQWTYPSANYIGMVNILGYRFPLEEMIYWIILATPTILAYYEYFADNRTSRDRIHDNRLVEYL